MGERIHTYRSAILGADGVRYRVHAEGARTPLGTWHGWLVFEPEGAAAPRLRTDRETTQPNREHLVYWAGGLEPIYLDGALTRARISASEPTA
jgi:hypothetical protein